MSLTPEEKRRRQAIDCDPANKCQAGCGNTARLGEDYCGTHLEAKRREEEQANEIQSLHSRIYALQPAGSFEESVREILSDIVGRLEVTS